MIHVHQPFHEAAAVLTVLGGFCLTVLVVLAVLALSWFALEGLSRLM